MDKAGNILQISSPPHSTFKILLHCTLQSISPTSFYIFRKDLTTSDPPVKTYYMAIKMPKIVIQSNVYTFINMPLKEELNENSTVQENLILCVLCIPPTRPIKKIYVQWKYVWLYKLKNTHCWCFTSPFCQAGWTETPGQSVQASWVLGR